MSGFEEAFAKVMAAEGINGDAFDKGGKHKYGISQRAYPDLNLDTLTKEDAKKIYKRDYWDKIKADELPANLRGTAFDAAVNQGVGFATRALAKAGGNPEDFNQLRADRYNSIVAKDPSQNRYIKGWMNRLNTYAEPGTYAPATNPPVTAPAAAPANTAPTPAPLAQTAPVGAPVKPVYPAAPGTFVTDDPSTWPAAPEKSWRERGNTRLPTDQSVPGQVPASISATGMGQAPAIPRGPSVGEQRMLDAREWGKADWEKKNAARGKQQLRWDSGKARHDAQVKEWEQRVAAAAADNERIAQFRAANGLAPLGASDQRKPAGFAPAAWNQARPADMPSQEEYLQQWPLPGAPNQAQLSQALRSLGSGDLLSTYLDPNFMRTR